MMRINPQETVPIGPDGPDLPKVQLGTENDAQSVVIQVKERLQYLKGNLDVVCKTAAENEKKCLQQLADLRLMFERIHQEVARQIKAVYSPTNKTLEIAQDSVNDQIELFNRTLQTIPSDTQKYVDVINGINQSVSTLMEINTTTQVCYASLRDLSGVEDEIKKKVTLGTTQPVLLPFDYSNDVALFSETRTCVPFMTHAHRDTDTLGCLTKYDDHRLLYTVQQAHRNSRTTAYVYDLQTKTTEPVFCTIDQIKQIIVLDHTRNLFFVISSNNANMFGIVICGELFWMQLNFNAVHISRSDGTDRFVVMTKSEVFCVEYDPNSIFVDKNNRMSITWHYAMTIMRLDKKHNPGDWRDLRMCVHWDRKLILTGEYLSHISSVGFLSLEKVGPACLSIAKFDKKHFVCLICSRGTCLRNQTPEVHKHSLVFYRDTFENIIRTIDLPFTHSTPIAVIGNIVAVHNSFRGETLFYQ